MFIKNEKVKSKEDKYKAIIKYTKALFSKNEKAITNLSNASALIKSYFNELNWVGFYLYENNNLILGPFQGLPACTLIEIGNGVCGTAAKQQETLIVKDVNKFPGHIFCDSNSKSEIVIPIIKDNALYGVLDIDSSELDHFDEIDKEYLNLFIEEFKEFI